VLRRIFGPKREEKVKIRWRRRQNELHNLYPSPDIIRVTKLRRVRWAGHMARMIEMRNTYKILVGTPERKSPLGRTRQRLNNII